MTTTTVFNVTERPVRFTVHGNRVPGRESTVVTDIEDKYYIAALTRGDLVVLSEIASPVKQEPVANAATEPEPTPVAAEETLAADEPAAEQADTESKKKQPSKAKEN